jgi:predicted phosphodiesterase
MRLAILSDLHNATSAFQTVMRHAQRHQADRLIYLGDLGSDPALFAALHSREIACTFGNWEVSGLRRLPAPWAAWVAEWPAKLAHGDICLTHATPDIPATVTNTATAANYMAQGIGWHQLFPRLHSDEQARWDALATLESDNLRAAFHGHTHIQEVWSYAAGRWRAFLGPAEFVLEPGSEPQPTRYLIGVGSAGAPQDGPTLRYAIYDDSDRRVQLMAVTDGA